MKGVFAGRAPWVGGEETCRRFESLKITSDIPFSLARWFQKQILEKIMNVMLECSKY